MYAVALLALTLLPLGTYPYPPHNPYPFATIGQLFGRDGIDVSVARLIALNIVAFIPLGVLTPVLVPRLKSWLTVLAVGLAASIAIELTQLGLSAVAGYVYRQADIDDVILNVAGAMLGRLLLATVNRRMAPTQG